jgi:hypothetical protein
VFPAFPSPQTTFDSPIWRFCSSFRHILVLGRVGLENVEKQLRSMLQEVDLWSATSLGADYPAA